MRRTAVIITVLALGVVLGATATAAIVRSAAPVREVLAQDVNPQGAKGRTMYLQRVTIPAGSPLAAHFHEGTQIAAIDQGRLEYTVLKGLPVRVVDFDASGGAPTPVRTIAPGETYVVRAGYGVVEPAGTIHQVRALAGADVVIYVSSLLRNGAPLSNAYAPAG